MIALLLLLAASETTDAPTLKSGDVAVIDCRVKKDYMAYPVPSTPSFVGNERWVFHIKSWGLGRPGKAIWDVTDGDDRTYSNDVIVLPSVNGDKINLSFLYSDLGMANVALTSAREGTATVSATDSMRHGEGEYQVSGECKTVVKRAPKGSGR
jgi:hypothetical protein